MIPVVAAISKESDMRNESSVKNVALRLGRVEAPQGE